MKRVSLIRIWLRSIAPAMAGAFFFMAGNPGVAGDFVATSDPEPTESAFDTWWNGPGLTGNWLGARDTFEDYGLKFKGKYYGAYFGVVDSQRGARGFWDQGLEFGADLNFGKLLGVEGLKGVKGFGGVRWRDPRSAADPNEFVEASSMFNPSNWVSGVQWRLLNFGLQISSEDFLGVEDLFVLRGGWLQPQKEFIDQPLSKLFLNNAVNSSKGVGGNIPFSSSFSTWGGTLEINPIDWYYFKGGLFMAYPGATSSDNHGLAFEGFGPDQSQNGLMGMVETGVTPKLGASELPGKYAVGAYYWGNRKNSFNGTSQFGQYGFYFQADQMLYREPSPAAEPVVYSKGSKNVLMSSGKGGKTFKEPAPEEPKLSDQGLSMFNLVSIAPKYNNLYPFYFQSGLVYKGLIPGRDKDQAMFAVAYGSYSYYNTLANRARGRTYQPNYTIFLEWGYRVQINKWAFIQPFAQYAIRPNGSDNVGNATILGFYTGVDF